MDAQFRSAPVGIGRIDANGALTALNVEFARLFAMPMKGAIPRPTHQIPAPLQDCWREILESVDGAPSPRRWNVTVDAPPGLRSVDVIGWAAAGRDGEPVVRLLAAERPDSSSQPLSGAAERARLAREIHDGLAQELWLAKLTAAKLARHPTLDDEARGLCEELLRSLDAGLVEARTAVLAIRSQDEPSITLAELVKRQVDEFSDRFGIRVDSDLEDGQAVPPRVSIEMLRILQEALNNVRKHAHARRTVVRVGSARGTLTLSIRDDGVGFDPTIVATGYGRQSMHERAQSIGGKLAITSVPGRGTRVALRVPATQLVSHR